jgi:hypothetical protein
MTRMAVDKALHYALVTGFLVTVAGLFLALTLSVKAMILAARVAMPSSLGLCTYFLPSDAPLMVSTIVTMRVSVSVYRWTVETLGAYLPRWDRMGMRI